MDYLDEGVLTEILMRLPATSLLRFKCVSRLWHHVISDPEFAKAQLRMSLQGKPSPSEKLFVPVYFRDHQDSLDESIFTTLTLEEHTSIRGSCHGLVCLQASHYRQFFVYNPTTRDSWKLPKSNGLRYPTGEAGYAELTCGFGYDTLKDDYKLLVRYTYCTGHEQTQSVEIYSLRSNSWRSIGDVNHHHDLQGDGRYSNGFLHWVSRKGQGYTIVSFDMATKEFREGLLPMPSFRLQGGHVRLSVSGGGTLIVYRTKWPTIEAWIMKDRGLNSTWTELCCFLMKELPGILYGCESPMIKDGKTLLCVRRGGYSVDIYDPVDGSRKTFRIPIDCTDRIINYVESLISVQVPSVASRPLQKTRVSILRGKQF